MLKLRAGYCFQLQFQLEPVAITDSDAANAALTARDMDFLVGLLDITEPHKCVLIQRYRSLCAYRSLGLRNQTRVAAAQ
jgi:hypothetical protein